MDPVLQSDAPRSAVDRFRLPVIGGTFTVAAVLLAPGQDPGQAVESIRSQPTERWLVLTAPGQAQGEDALALINDAYECQVMALGSLKTDPE